MQGQSGSSALMLIVLLVIGLAAVASIMLRARRRGPDVPAQPAIGGQPIAGRTSSSLADDLNSLADLRDKGILSSREFEAEKARLLGSRS